MQTYAGQFINLCWAIFLIYWVASAFKTKRTVEKRSWGWRIPVAGAFAVYLFLNNFGMLSAYERKALWPKTMVLDVFAAALTLAGLVVTLWARRTLGRNWSGNVTYKEDHELIVRGPYRFMRHPIYGGLLLMMLGTAIWPNYLNGFSLLAVGFVCFWVKSLQEENLLTKHFQKEYPVYKKRVKAFIPFVFLDLVRPAPD